MNRQIILCVESDRRAQTDNIYIKETIHRFYEIGNDTKITFINMGGKSKFKSNKNLCQINQYVKDYRIGQSIVVYCIDTDSYESNPSQNEETEAIRSFVVGNDYELIWFCRDVEEVYLGKRASKGDKKNMAVGFMKKKRIENVAVNALNCSTESNGSSNILAVLDKYLKRK